MKGDVILGPSQKIWDDLDIDLETALKTLGATLELMQTQTTIWFS
jgi:hypothetical protein